MNGNNINRTKSQEHQAAMDFDAESSTSCPPPTSQISKPNYGTVDVIPQISPTSSSATDGSHAISSIPLEFSTPNSSPTALQQKPNHKTGLNGESTARTSFKTLNGHKTGMGMRSSSGRRIVHKTHSTFAEDAQLFLPGTVPHNMVAAIVIGIACGIASFLYYAGLEAMLAFLWRKLPQHYLHLGSEGENDGDVSESPYAVLWIPLVGFTMALAVGLTVQLVGEPGDLPYTIKCVHETGHIPLNHVLPMVLASQSSILAGGSLGPEAPLVAICAAIGGFISERVFQTSTTDRNILRKHTLCGMAGALAAFFGCPLGGSLFALEVNSRMGIEYFEHTVEAILTGVVCLAVFRGLARMPIEPIWDIAIPKLTSADAMHVLYGVLLGLLGAFVAFVFAQFHFNCVMASFRKAGLLESRETAVTRALVGAVVVVGTGMMIPQTMFWGEEEFQTIATQSPSSTLTHIWPTSGLFDFEESSVWMVLLVGVTKLVAISFTVAGGYRGGFIFPLFAAGAALGRVIQVAFPFIPVQLACLGMAAAINVAVTRTALATSIILCNLAGEPCAITGVLASSLVSLMVTAYMPFITTQQSRADIEHSIFQPVPDSGQNGIGRGHSGAICKTPDGDHQGEQLDDEKQPILV